MSFAESDCLHVVEIEQEPRHHLIFTNQWVRAFAVDIPAGDRTLCHHHPSDYYVYVTAPAEITSTRRGEEPKRLSYSGGEVEASSAGMVHVVENVGATAFRNVVVEVLFEDEKIRRGAEPSFTGRNAVRSQMFSDARIAIWAIEIEPGAQVAVCGPGVLASPWECPVELAVQGTSSRMLAGFRDLVWLDSAGSFQVRNAGDSVAQLILFQLGRG